MRASRILWRRRFNIFGLKQHKQTFPLPNDVHMADFEAAPHFSKESRPRGPSEYMVSLELSGYEIDRVRRAVFDAVRFLQEVVPPTMARHLEFVRRAYGSGGAVPIPAGVRDTPEIRAFIMAEAAKVAEELRGFPAEGWAPVVRENVKETVFTVPATKFKFGRTKEKISERVYRTTIDVRLPVRDGELEQRIHSIPAWLAPGVEAQFLTKRMESLPFQPLTRPLGELYPADQSLVERYFPADVMERQVAPIKDPSIYMPLPTPDPNKKPKKKKKKK
eukprot:RCo047346